MEINNKKDARWVSRRELADKNSTRLCYLYRVFAAVPGSGTST